MSSLASKQGPRYRHTSGEEAPYETIGVEKLTPIIGAEISGVDLSGTLSNRTMDEIHQLYLDRQAGYRSAALRIDIGHRSPAEAAAEILVTVR